VRTATGVSHPRGLAAVAAMAVNDVHLRPVESAAFAAHFLRLAARTIAVSTSGAERPFADVARPATRNSAVPTSAGEVLRRKSRPRSRPDNGRVKCRDVPQVAHGQNRVRTLS
jgi:hypothetical protein